MYETIVYLLFKNVIPVVVYFPKLVTAESQVNKEVEPLEGATEKSVSPYQAG